MTKNTQGSELREKIERIDVGDQNDKGCTITLGELLDYKSIDLIWEVADQAITSSNQALLQKVRDIVVQVRAIKNIYMDEYDVVRKISYGRHRAYEDCRDDVLDLFEDRLAELEKEI